MLPCRTVIGRLTLSPTCFRMLHSGTFGGNLFGNRHHFVVHAPMQFGKEISSSGKSSSGSPKRIS